MIFYNRRPTCSRTRTPTRTTIACIKRSVACMHTSSSTTASGNKIECAQIILFLYASLLHCVPSGIIQKLRRVQLELHCSYRQPDHHTLVAAAHNGLIIFLENACARTYALSFRSSKTRISGHFDEKQKKSIFSRSYS